MSGSDSYGTGVHRLRQEVSAVMRIIHREAKSHHPFDFGDCALCVDISEEVLDAILPLTWASSPGAVEIAPIFIAPTRARKV